MPGPLLTPADHLRTRLTKEENGLIWYAYTWAKGLGYRDSALTKQIKRKLKETEAISKW